MPLSVGLTAGARPVDGDIRSLSTTAGLSTGARVRCHTPVGAWGDRVQTHTGVRLHRRDSFPNPHPLPLSLSFLNFKEMHAGAR